MKSKLAENKIKDAIDSLVEYIDGDEYLISGFSSKNQLLRFKETLLNALNEVSEGHCPPQNKRYLGIAMVVVDCWPFDFQLGRLLIEAEKAYKEF